MDQCEKILSYIREELLEDSDITISNGTSLFQDRILDSLNLVALISFLEDTFKIKVNTAEVTVENLDSVDKMLNYVDGKAAQTKN